MATATCTPRARDLFQMTSSAIFRDARGQSLQCQQRERSFQVTPSTSARACVRCGRNRAASMLPLLLLCYFSNAPHCDENCQAGLAKFVVRGHRVWRRTHDRLGGDIGTGTLSIFDDEWLAKTFRQPLPYQPCDDVAAGCEAHDQAHRPRRIGLRPITTKMASP